MNVYIAASCYDADNLGNYLKDTTVYTKADENVTVDGVEYVLYQAVWWDVTKGVWLRRPGIVNIGRRIFYAIKIYQELAE